MLLNTVPRAAGGSIRRVGVAVLAATLLTGLVGTSAVASPVAPAVGTDATQDRTALQQAMSELTASEAAGVQVRVHDQQGDWTGSSGVKELNQGEKVPTIGRFRAGSIIKPFVSTVVLQLVGEGKVGLDDPVDRYLPWFGLDKRITVRMVLQHTSGVFNHTGESNPDGTVEPGVPWVGQEFVDDRFHTYRPEELVRFALSKPARFEPGSRWSYSNTNYVVAALLIEKVSGTPYSTQVERRIVRPLGLGETTLPGTRSGIPGLHAHGYFAYRQEGELKVVDITRLNPSRYSSAGEIISTTKDLDRFISGLLGGKLLAPELLAEMRKTIPTGAGFDYGLGLMQRDFGPGCGGAVLGHTGGVHGYLSWMFSNADRTKRLEMSVTAGVVDFFDPVAADKVDKAALKVVTVAFCS